MVSLPKEHEHIENKFIYPEFAGAYGERILNTIMQSIVTKAMHYTWMDAVYYQKPGNRLYAGVSKIKEIRKTGERKVQMDLQALEERRLMQISAEIHTEKCGDQIMTSLRRYKDFTPLYDLAHEFYEWQKSGNYALLPPSWELADAIRQDTPLYSKLVRFECYRRVLECKRPGRKKRACSYTQEEYGEHNTKEYLNTISPYRSECNSITSEFENSNRSAQLKEEGQDACSHPILSYSQNGGGSGYMIENVDIAGCSEMKPETIEIAKDWGAEQSAKREMKQAARIEAKERYSANLEARIEERIEAIKRQVANDKESLRKTLMPRGHSHFNYEICAMMSNFTASLHDEPSLERSNMTWGLDRFQETGLEVEEFIQLLYVCYAQAWKQTNVRARNKTNQINRMPVFRGIMKNEIKKLVGVVVVEVTQSCEAPGVQVACHTNNNESETLIVVEGNEVMLIQDAQQAQDAQPQTLEIRQANDTSAGDETRQIIQANKNVVEARVVEQQNIVKPSASLVRRQKTSEAIKALRSFVYDSMWSRGDCTACGCPIATTGGRCVVCYPLQEWDTQKRKQIKTIVATIPTIEQAKELLEDSHD